ncbi:MAG: hypothetical protein SH859_10910 [Hyphomicrobium aestuarii]|nr:hypothetical protein [Hyphomicrobium aestuarii]
MFKCYLRAGPFDGNLVVPSDIQFCAPGSVVQTKNSGKYYWQTRPIDISSFNAEQELCYIVGLGSNIRSKCGYGFILDVVVVKLIEPESGSGLYLSPEINEQLGKGKMGLDYDLVSR